MCLISHKIFDVIKVCSLCHEEQTFIFLIPKNQTFFLIKTMNHNTEVISNVFAHKIYSIHKTVLILIQRNRRILYRYGTKIMQDL